MTTSNISKKWSAMRHVLHALGALFIVLALLLGGIGTMPASALPPVDPIDPDPIGGEPFEAPASGFKWSVPSRFGARDENGLIDYKWDPISMTYETSLIYPSSWPVKFNGCQTELEAENGISTINTYTWEFSSPGYSHTLTGLRCWFTHSFPSQGTYHVKLSIRNRVSGAVVPEGLNPPYFEQDIQVKDILIISMGDSFASGEGNPDVPLEYAWRGPLVSPPWVELEPAKWEDRRCHRSAFAGPAQAALAIEAADPHTSVTFVSFACSGATLATPIYDLFGNPNGTGMLGEYKGAEMRNGDAEWIPSQMDQLRAALVNPAGGDARQIDALIISGGGNDIHFGDIAQACLLEENCWEVSYVMESPGMGKFNLTTLINRALGNDPNAPSFNLRANYEALAGEINALSPAPAEVYLTQYPDLTRDDNGSACRMLDDIFWPNPLLAFTPVESERAASFALAGLNDVVADVAREYQWQLVDGLAEYLVDPNIPAGTPGQFVVGPDGKGHGYCASDNWIRRADEAELIQGPVNLRALTKGTLHPTIRGHQVYKERLLRYMLPNLAVGLPPVASNPPSFNASFSSGDIMNITGANGWFIGSQQSGTYASKVVLEISASDEGSLRGASFLVNGVEGCPAGMTCTTTLNESNTLMVWRFEFTADGVYRLQFSAQDGHSQTSIFNQEIKVDLTDPVFNPAPGTFNVTEGSTISLTATASDATSGLVNYDWDLNNDGQFETLDETPAFSAASLDGPTSQVIGVRVTDGAGRFTTHPATIQVANGAPALSNIAASAASINESGSITLTGSLSDPSSLDALSLVIDWGDGSPTSILALPAGSTQFSISHIYADDNPAGTAADLYAINLTLSDDDGASGLGSASVTVNNVAPQLTILTPTEGALFPVNTSVNFEASFVDANAADGHTCSLDWDDGSTTPGTVAGGKCTASHAFSGAGVYTVQATLSDDDTGTVTQPVMVIVYDPSAGFVTGGGWINSPAGAYTADPSLSGRASFGFVAKYQKGASAPVGQTEFQFQAASFKFHSSQYEWLVVAGARGQFRGAGSVNGVEGYSFLLTVTDGQVNGGGGEDKFRIKIWNAGGVVYDNVVGASDDLDNARPQPIGGGSIVIKTGK